MPPLPEELLPPPTPPEVEPPVEPPLLPPVEPPLLPEPLRSIDEPEPDDVPPALPFLWRECLLLVLELLESFDWGCD